MFRKVLVILAILGLVFAAAGYAQTPKKGGTLVAARGGDSPGLDPAYETDGNSFMICDSVMEALIAYKEESTDVLPGLAEKWEVTPDGLNYTFHLRKGVKFHDGTDFNADAVVFSHGRQMKERDGRLKFFKTTWELPKYERPPEYWLSMEMEKIVKSIEAKDDSTVIYHLNRPEAPFIANMGMDFADIVSPTAVLKHGANFKSNPVGTGPFKFVSWVKDDRITLEANDAYWGGRPYLDKVIFRSIPDSSVRFLELKSGNIDLCMFPNPEDIDLAKKDPNLKIVSQPGMNIGYVSFNHTKPLWQDARVRRAMAMAMDKKAIVDNIYYGLGTVAKNLIPPTMWSYNNDVKDIPHDPEGAKKLLAEAKFADLLKAAGQTKVTLWSMPVARPYNPNGMKVGEAIQADLKKVGVDIELVTFEWGTYLKRQRMQEPGMDMFQLGWTGDNGDPDNFFAVLLDGLADPNVRTQWKNPEYHELMTKGKQATSQEERIKIYRRAQELLAQEVPLINVAHSLVIWPMRKNVMNYHLHPTQSIYFAKVWKE